MPDRVITFRVALEGLEAATAATQEFQGVVRGVGTAAQEGASGAAALGTAIDKTEASLSGTAVVAKQAGEAVEKVGDAAAAARAGLSAAQAGAEGISTTLRERMAPAAERAVEAFRKLSTAETPRTLMRGIVDAETALDGFKKSADAARAAGEKIGPGVANSIRAMERDLTSATQKLGEVRDRMGDIRTKADAVGQGWTQAAASGGSFNSMLNNFESTADGATKTAAQLALKTIGIAAAFKAGIEAGKGFNAWVDEVARASGRSENALAGLAKVIGDTGAAGAGFKRWANEAALATKQYGDELVPVTFKVNALMKVHQEAEKQLNATKLALKALGIEWHSAGEGAAKLDKEIKLVGDALAQAARKGEDWGKTILANAPGLTALRDKMEAQGRSLDSLTAKERAAILVAEGLTEAEKKQAEGRKTLREAGDKLDEQMVKILTTYRQELEAAQKSRDIAGATTRAYEKLAEALGAYGKAHGLTAGPGAEVVKRQSALLDVMKQTNAEGIDKQKAALDKLGPALGDAAAKTESLAESEAKLQAAVNAGMALWDRQEERRIARNDAIDAEIAKNDALAESFKRTAGAASNAAEAFGKVANGLTAVSAASDNATAGLQGVAWEVRHATQPTVELTDAQRDLVEQLAKISDAGGASSLWLGHLIAQFEAGEITLDAFKSKANQLLQELQKINGSGFMGNLAGELNALNSALAEFYKNANAAPQVPH